ncbi:hypothetical protein GCWU000246_01792 [Jonquetella anthropi E3_33 E1]|nr:hypothetical protein GCWU000246_01792 [Jonquetella anthropi E3_33 E1]
MIERLGSRSAVCLTLGQRLKEVIRWLEAGRLYGAAKKPRSVTGGSSRPAHFRKKQKRFGRACFFSNLTKANFNLILNYYSF